MSMQKSTKLPIIRKRNDIYTTFDQIQHMIRDQAYRIFHHRNSDEGNDLSDWLQAESEVLGDIDLSLKEDKKQVFIQGEMEGFLPEDIEVKAGDGIIEVGGIHSEKSSSKKNGVSRTSSTTSNFYKSFSLPDSVDTDKIEVKLKNGKFTARIPKTSH